MLRSEVLVTQPAAPLSPSAASSATVLLVDDEAPIRRSLGPYLERSGYRVMPASDGVEALELLAAYEIDIVVSDVLMPRMDGRELVRRVRAGRPRWCGGSAGRGSLSGAGRVVGPGCGGARTTPRPSLLRARPRGVRAGRSVNVPSQHQRTCLPSF